MLQRAYAVFETKAADPVQRVIEGIASTPEPDRSGDVMVPKGARFALPMPFLWFHNQDEPIGEVFEARVEAGGIYIKARVAKVDKAGPVKDRVDQAWDSFTAQPPLVRGLSIGWAPRTYERIPDTKFVKHTEWVWAELSAVTVPMNQSATILAVKQAASGPHHPGASGLPRTTPMTTQEQITSLTSTRASKVSAMQAMMDKATAEAITFDQDQTQQYDQLALEVKGIDGHLLRLAELEKLNVAAAVPITPQTNTPAAAAVVRDGTPVVQVKSQLPPGTAFARMVMAKVVGKNSLADAIEYAKRWEDTTPEVALMLKAAVNWGTIAEPAWAAPLAVQQPIKEFLDLLRPATLIGRIPNLRQVPFNISMPIQTGGGTYGWVGEGAPKPVGNLQFSSANLGIAKSAGIIVISQELAKLSSPSAEAAVRNDMVRGMAQFLDTQFIDPTVAAVANVSPASITNGAVSVGSSGSSADNARTDIKALIASFVAANQSVASSVLIMSEANAFALSVALNPLGQPLYPGMSMNGGNILGIPVITSQVAGSTVALVYPPEILFADDGGVNIDVSTEAAVEMSTTPTSPANASTVLVSLWQQNLIGLKAERFINWKRARLTAVRYTTATYV